MSNRRIMISVLNVCDYTHALSKHANASSRAWIPVHAFALEVCPREILAAFVKYLRARMTPCSQKSDFLMCYSAIMGSMCASTPKNEFLEGKLHLLKRHLAITVSVKIVRDRSESFRTQKSLDLLE